MSSRPRGKWSDPGVPHKGWTCVDFEDLEDLSGLCGMCESQEIRYVHYMQHPRYEGLIGAGCECAARMSEDYDAAYEAAKSRERLAQSRARRRAIWLDRNWKTSAKGNSYLKADGFIIVIFSKGSQWSAVIEDKVSEKKRFSQRLFKTEDEAKLAAFDGMTKLKAECEKFHESSIYGSRICTNFSNKSCGSEKTSFAGSCPFLLSMLKSRQHHDSTNANVIWTN